MAFGPLLVQSLHIFWVQSSIALIDPRLCNARAYPYSLNVVSIVKICDNFFNHKTTEKHAFRWLKSMFIYDIFLHMVCLWWHILSFNLRNWNFWFFITKETQLNNNLVNTVELQMLEGYKNHLWTNYNITP